MSEIIAAAIGETVTFHDGERRRTETVVARRNGVTITKNVDGYSAAGFLTAWVAVSGMYAEDTGWCFAATTTPDQAIDMVIDRERAWNGLAAAAA